MIDGIGCARDWKAECEVREGWVRSGSVVATNNVEDEWEGEVYHRNGNESCNGHHSISLRREGGRKSD